MTAEWNGCVANDSLTITLNTAPSVSFVADTLNGCSPLSVRFTPQTNNALDSCIWDFGDGTTFSSDCGSVTHAYLSSGLHTVILTSYLNGCPGNTTYDDYIDVYESPQASFTIENSELLIENPVQFQNNSSGAEQYFWNFGDGSDLDSTENPSHIFAEDVASYVVELTAISSEGCSDTVSLSVQFEDQLIFYIPNSFSPDGDEINPIFFPVFTSGFDETDFEFSVYNRWGELLFTSMDHRVGWDGTFRSSPVQSGTYVWRIEFKEASSDRRYLYHGNITLIR